MTRIAWTSLTLATLALAGSLAAQEEFFLLEDMTIEGQVREPSVEIISSRLLPEISGFRLEKSFLDQARRPDEELVDVDPFLGRQARLENPEALLSRPRIVRRGLNSAEPSADQSGEALMTGKDGADDE